MNIIISSLVVTFLIVHSLSSALATDATEITPTTLHVFPNDVAIGQLVQSNNGRFYGAGTANKASFLFSIDSNGNYDLVKTFDPATFHTTHIEGLPTSDLIFLSNANNTGLGIYNVQTKALSECSFDWKGRFVDFVAADNSSVIVMVSSTYNNNENFPDEIFYRITDQCEKTLIGTYKAQNVGGNWSDIDYFTYDSLSKAVYFTWFVPGYEYYEMGCFGTNNFPDVDNNYIPNTFLYDSSCNCFYGIRTSERGGELFSYSASINNTECITCKLNLNSPMLLALDNNHRVYTLSYNGSVSMIEYDPSVHSLYSVALNLTYANDDINAINPRDTKYILAIEHVKPQHTASYYQIIRIPKLLDHTTDPQ